MQHEYLLSFSITESEENGKSLFRRKRQSRSNYCPFPREPYPDKEIKIGVHSPREERESVASTQEDKTINWRSKIEKIRQDPLIMRDHCFKTYLYSSYIRLAIIKRDGACSPGGMYYHFSKLTIVLLL